MSTAPFAKRKIDIVFRLGQGSFGGSGYNTITLTGLRCVVYIQKAILPASPAALIQIFGLSKSHMNDIAKAGLVWSFRHNQVAVMAGDDQSGMFQIYNGEIQEAYPEGTDPPNIAFTVVAFSGNSIKFTAAKPASFQGSFKIEDILTRIIQGSGLTLQNKGVTTTLINPYYKGTVADQIRSACQAADCFYYVDWIKNILTIWPKNQVVQGAQVFEVNENTGLIGYPSFQLNMVKVRCLFDPAIHGPSAGEPGININLKSTLLPAANGLYSLTNVSYNLSSEQPGGPWEMELTAYANSTQQQK